MKIIGVDNFDREIKDDFLVAENINNKEMAEVMCKALNAKYCDRDDSPIHYRVVEAGYELRIFQP